MTLRDQLITVSDHFAVARGISRARVSTIVLNRGKKLTEMVNGSADVTTVVWERSMQWFSDNWPADAVWPEHIDRPQASVPEEVETSLSE